MLKFASNVVQKLSNCQNPNWTSTHPQVNMTLYHHHYHPTHKELYSNSISVFDYLWNLSGTSILDNLWTLTRLYAEAFEPTNHHPPDKYLNYNFKYSCNSKSTSTTTYNLTLAWPSTPPASYLNLQIYWPNNRCQFTWWYSHLNRLSKTILFELYLKWFRLPENWSLSMPVQ